MKSTSNKGRPTENITPIIKYTQIFKDFDGAKYTWVWDKEKSSGPLSVTVDDPQYYKADKLVNELEVLNKKYLPKKGDRKPRILKVDKERIEAIEKELEDIHNSFFPEDRVVIKIRKNGKTAKTKI